MPDSYCFLPPLTLCILLSTNAAVALEEGIRFFNLVLFPYVELDPKV